MFPRPRKKGGLPLWHSLPPLPWNSVSLSLCLSTRGRIKRLAFVYKKKKEITMYVLELSVGQQRAAGARVLENQQINKFSTVESSSKYLTNSLATSAVYISCSFFVFFFKKKFLFSAERWRNYGELAIKFRSRGIIWFFTWQQRNWLFHFWEGVLRRASGNMPSKRLMNSLASCDARYSIDDGFFNRRFHYGILYF